MTIFWTWLVVHSLLGFCFFVILKVRWLQELKGDLPRALGTLFTIGPLFWIIFPFVLISIG